MTRKLILFFFFTLLCNIVLGQVVLSRDTTVKILTSSGDILKNGWDITQHLYIFNCGSLNE